jgi:hypothetical protein
MILISSGCSFSFDEFTWPTHLAKYLNAEHHQMGWGSSGNAFISRRAIQKISELLNNNIDHSQILVGIMWSGPDRIDLYTEDSVVSEKMSVPRTSTTGICVWPSSDNRGKWIIMNAGFKSVLARIYYKTFYNQTQSMIHTYEHVLRTQWFLEKHKIKYFMTTYTNEVFYNQVNTIQTDYLKNLVDWTKFLPIDGCYEWVRDNSKYPFPDPNDFHPGEKQHQDFTKKVILPFLKKEYNLMPV